MKYFVGSACYWNVKTICWNRFLKVIIYFDKVGNFEDLCYKQDCEI